MSDAPDFDIDARKRDTSYPVFYTEAVHLKAASETEGRAVFGEREMVRIVVPGDRKTEAVHIVKDEHKHRWPQHYAAFKANREAPMHGTPLEELSGVSMSQLEELKYNKVRTIEELAGLPDEILSKVAPMYGRDLRARAQRRLDAEAGNAPMEKLAAENTQLRTTMDEMKAQMAEMQKAIANQSKA